MLLGLWLNSLSLFRTFFPKCSADWRCARAHMGTCWPGRASSAHPHSSSFRHQLTYSRWHLSWSSFFMLPVHFIYFLNHFCELHDYCTHNHRRVEVIILKAFLQCMHSDQDVICISYPLTPCPKIETKHSVMSDCFELVLIWLEISHKAALVRRDYV